MFKDQNRRQKQQKMVVTQEPTMLQFKKNTLQKYEVIK